MSVKKYNGLNWVDLTTIKKYDGSSWVDLQYMRRYDGTNWIDMLQPTFKFLQYTYSGTGSYYNIQEDGSLNYYVASNVINQSNNIWFVLRGDFGTTINVSYYLRQSLSKEAYGHTLWCANDTQISTSLSAAYQYNSYTGWRSFSYAASQNIESIYLLLGAHYTTTNTGAISNIVINGTNYKFAA